MPAQHVRQKLQSAQAEIEAGRPWRAKEMLQGSIATDYALEPEILRAYGTLLDSLGDKVEAGKFLFLSGHREGHSGEAVEIFLERYRKASAENLIGLFPAQIRRHGLGHLPESARAELEARGALPEELERRAPLPYAAGMPTWRDNVLLGVFLLLCCAFVLVFMIGLFTVLRWIL